MIQVGQDRIDRSTLLETMDSEAAHDRVGREADQGRSFTIDGEAVVLEPDGLARFEELRLREAARTAILYAFDLIEHNGEDLRNLPLLDRKAALARLRETKAGIVLNEHVAEDGSYGV